MSGPSSDLRDFLRYAERERGAGPLKAAIGGATRIQGPVIFAILTTVTAFTPLLFVPGTLGKILGAIPIVVISVLLLSLVESLFILPNHLSHLPAPGESAKNPVTRFFDTLQKGVDSQFQRFVQGPLDRGIRFAIRSPSVVVAAAVSMVILTVATIPAGILRIQFFPDVEGDVVSANLEMPEGTPAARTLEVAERIRLAGERVAGEFEAQRDPEEPKLVQGIYQVVGSRPGGGGPGGGGGSGALAGNIAGVQIQLLDAELREVSSADFEARWREELCC